MHAVYKKQLLAVCAIAFVWALGSWHWYVCGVKGFCPIPAPVSASVAQGNCNEYLTESIRVDWANSSEEVRKLQAFLNEYEGEELTLSGVYGAADEAAVRRFQERYRSEVLTPWGKNEPTGFVHTTTRTKINELYCARHAGSVTN